MKIGVTIGYSGSSFSVPPDELKEIESLGYDSVWTSEAYGSDALTPAAWALAHTERITVGTAIIQMGARTPTAAAMAAMTLQALSGDRFVLGIGPSGPQVIEGWYGVPYGKPLTRTREYIEIVRKILAREAPLEHAGEHYAIPAAGARHHRARPPAQEHPAREAGAEDLHRRLHPGRRAHRGRGRRRVLPRLHEPRALRPVRGAAERGLRGGGRRQEPRRFRDRALRPGPCRRRPRRLPHGGQAAPRALCRRDGRALEELLQRLRRPARLRGSRGGGAGPVPRRQAAGRRPRRSPIPSSTTSPWSGRASASANASRCGRTRRRRATCRP